MRDYKTAQSSVEPETPDYIQDCARQQLAGNQAAQAAMTPVEDDSLFSFLDLGAASTDVANASPFAPSSDMTPDEQIRDYANLQKTPTVIPVDGFDIGNGKLSRSFTQSDESDALGDSTLTGGSNVDFAEKSVGINAAYSAGPASAEDKGASLGAALTVDANGKIDASVAAKVGKVGGGVSGMLDLGDGGQVQAVGFGATASIAGASASVTNALRLGSVDVNGNSVSSATGLMSASSVLVNGVGGNVGAGRSYTESLTFANAKEAEAHGKALAAGKHASVSEMTAADLLSLPEGARASYVVETSAKAGGSFVAAVGVDVKSKRTVDISARQGDVVELTVTDDGRAGGQVGLDGGLLSTGVAEHWFGNDALTYRVDLSDRDDAAAFEVFQRTGATDGLTFVGGSSLSGATSESKGTVPGMAVIEGAERSSGVLVEDGETSDVERGAYNADLTNDWSLNGALATAADIGAGASRVLSDSASRGFTKAGAYCRGQRSAEASSMGAESGRTDMLTGRGDGETLLVQKQVVDFDDQQQNARFLEDQIDRLSDQQHFNASELPASAATDREWTLESLVNSQGVAKIEDVLAADGLLPCESVEAQQAWMASREAYQGSARSTGDLRSAVADSGMQGEDAMECARALAGEGNVEQFLSLEGDDVWMGRDEHAEIQKEIMRLSAVAGTGDEASARELEAIRQQLRGRAEKLSAERYPEAPSELLGREKARVASLIRSAGVN